MAKNGPGITLTLRKISTGYKVVAVAGDDMNHLYSIARILIRSPEYNRCYAVGTDWEGNQLFNVQPEQVYQAPAPYVAPPQPSQFQAHYAAQQGYQQLPAPQGYYPCPPGHPMQQAAPGYRAVPEILGGTDAYGPPPNYPALPPRR